MEPHIVETRSGLEHDHYLQTPDTFARTALPGMSRGTGIVHAGAARGARFTEYTAEFEAGGTLAPSAVQRFCYVLDGEALLEGRSGMIRRHDRMGAGGYAYLPAAAAITLRAITAARVVVIEKPRVEADGVRSPGILVGEESAVAASGLKEDDAIQVRALLPEDAAFDFAVNIVTYEPGAFLPAVGMHVMEHGQMMLAGDGVVRLGGKWYPVTAGDFIWIAPYCPQWFGAFGKTPSRWLQYTDWNRRPLD